MTTHETSTFGALLRRYRLAASLSQETLAERARLSAATIAALERGRHSHPRLETVTLLAEALDLAAAARPVAATPNVATRAVPDVLLPPPTPLIGREHEEAAITHLLRLAAALTWFWRFYERLHEGRSALETMLARTDSAERSMARAKALYGAGMLAWTRVTARAPRPGRRTASPSFGRGARGHGAPQRSGCWA
jgi:transcriptional regulator with XRE-family HTH domain